MVIQLDIISILLALELLVVLFAGCIILWFKFKKEKNKKPQVIIEKQKASLSTPKDSLDSSYEDCLRSELKQLQDTMTGLPESQVGDVMDSRALLEVRQEFIKLELSAQDWLSDSDTHHEKLMEGIRLLLTHFNKLSDIGPDNTVVKDDEEKVDGSENYEDQLEYFKSVIDNQLNVMRALREKLAVAAGSEDGLSDEMKELMGHLEQAEKQAIELGRCVEVLEEENERLRQDTGSQQDVAVAGEVKSNDEVMEDIGGMESMVSNQQETISKLKGLLDDLALEASKAEELEDLIGHIQRANKELSGCIMVLEDENTMLRSEMERLRNNLSAILLANNEAGDDSELQYKNESLSKKMESLKSMIDIKDTTIGELQQKVEALKSEYMTATGKMPDIGEDE
ncbi:MAG: hypothetical protein GXP22_03195 [Gammaproteobacteria bacterium]|nr:hypothetical protein [Gammaproteobacteria bacterium]